MRLFAAPEALAAALLLRSQRLDVGAVLVTGIEQFSAYSVRPARSLPQLVCHDWWFGWAAPRCSQVDTVKEQVHATFGGHLVDPAVRYTCLAHNSQCSQTRRLTLWLLTTLATQSPQGTWGIGDGGAVCGTLHSSTRQLVIAVWRGCHAGRPGQAGVWLALLLAWRRWR